MDIHPRGRFSAVPVSLTDTSQGILTRLIGTVEATSLQVVNFLDDAHKNWNFLSHREIRFVLARVNADRGDAVTEAWSWAKFLRPALDVKTWASP